MKKLHLDYALAQVLNQKLGQKRFQDFLARFEYIISADKQTEDFLKEIFHNQKKKK